ncbi:MAG TPA: alpha/beta hydrolase, partial [Vicinamibacteria bacterium]|nr:alpha/beta hydrolase [Vicinamibacteria bacterium]
VRLAGVPALVVGLIPGLLLLPLYRSRQATFSLAAYPPLRPVAPPSRTDLVLEPSRPDLKTDVYAPEGPGPHPFVVVIHSGAWRSGDKGEGADASWAMARAGHVVLDVQYRLTPGNRFPSAVADVKCLLGRARERAAELQLDPDRGAYLGRSAGGEIALVAAYSAGDPRVAPSCDVPDRPVTSVVSLYGPTDLAWGYVNLIRPDVVTGSRALDAYLGGPPADFPEAYRLASPVAWVDRPLPRTLLVHGTADRLVSVENERRLARALQAAGRSVEVLELPLADHGFDAHAGGLAEQLARHVLLRFLAEDQGAAASRP